MQALCNGRATLTDLLVYRHLLDDEEVDQLETFLAMRAHKRAKTEGGASVG